MEMEEPRKELAARFGGSFIGFLIAAFIFLLLYMGDSGFSGLFGIFSLLSLVFHYVRD